MHLTNLTKLSTCICNCAVHIVPQLNARLGKYKPPQSWAFWFEAVSLQGGWAIAEAMDVTFCVSAGRWLFLSFHSTFVPRTWHVTLRQQEDRSKNIYAHIIVNICSTDWDWGCDRSGVWEWAQPRHREGTCKAQPRDTPGVTALHLHYSPSRCRK